MTDYLRIAYLFLSLLQARVGASVVRRLGDSDPREVFAVPLEELAERLKLTGNGRKAFETLERDFDPDEVLSRLAEKNIRVVTLADEDYPEKLSETPDQPPALFVKGEIPEGPTVALVGSQGFGDGGGGCSCSGPNSGRAGGVRGERAGARDKCGGASGSPCCWRAYGRGTRLRDRRGVPEVQPVTLRARSGGRGIVSEYYLGEQPLQWHFPARNRIFAGLSDAVVVVEAAEKSGALITARHAMEAGRDVWVVPGPLGFAECRGSNALLADGAGVLWDVDLFVDTLVPEPAPRRLSVAQDASVELPEKEAAALAGVGFEPVGVDVVAGRSGVEMRDLLPALAMLELKGYVTRDAGGAFVRNPAGGGAR